MPLVHSMEAPEDQIQKLSKDVTSYMSWLPKELREELLKYDRSAPEIPFWLLMCQKAQGFSARRFTVPKFHCIEFDSVQNEAILLCDDGVKVIDLANGSIKQTFLMDYANRQGRWIAFSASYIFSIAQAAAFAKKGNIIHVWDRKTGQCIQILNDKLGDPISHLVYDEKNECLVYGIRFGTLCKWDIPQGTCKKIAFDSGPNRLDYFTIDSLHNQLVTIYYPNQLFFWNIKDLTIEERIEKKRTFADSLHYHIFNPRKNNFIASRENSLLTYCFSDDEREYLPLSFNESKTEPYLVRYNEVTDCIFITTVPMFRGVPNRDDYSFLIIADINDGVWFKQSHLPITMLKCELETNCLYIALSNERIEIWHLQDPVMRKELIKLSETTHILKMAYFCWKNKLPLNLYNDLQLYLEFQQLPKQMQKTIEANVEVRFPPVEACLIKAIEDVPQRIAELESESILAGLSAVGLAALDLLLSLK